MGRRLSTRCIRSYDRMGIETEMESTAMSPETQLHPVIRPDGD